MFTFSNEYIIKSMFEMVRDEGDRIVSLGLATRDDLKNLIEPEVKIASKNADELLVVLGKIYTNLKAVHLSGDFEKLAEPEDVEQYLLETYPKKEEKKEDEEENKEEEAAVPEDEGMFTIYNSLEQMAYRCGMSGDHDSAYKIERTIRDIERIADSLSKEDIMKMAEEVTSALEKEDNEK